MEIGSSMNQLSRHCSGWVWPICLAYRILHLPPSTVNQWSSSPGILEVSTVALNKECWKWNSKKILLLSFFCKKPNVPVSLPLLFWPVFGKNVWPLQLMCRVPQEAFLLAKTLTLSLSRIPLPLGTCSLLLSTFLVPISTVISSMSTVLNLLNLSSGYCNSWNGSPCSTINLGS